MYTIVNTTVQNKGILNFEDRFVQADANDATLVLTEQRCLPDFFYWGFLCRIFYDILVLLLLLYDSKLHSLPKRAPEL